MPDPDTSPNLALPFLLPAQAQKHVTHNEALRILDLVTQLTIQEFDVATPPVQPLEGQIWAVAANAVSDWAGKDGLLAACLNGGWVYYTPRLGWRAYAVADGSFRVWTGAAWERQRLDDLSGVGIGTSHDETNRLAVASPASLFTHAGGSHRMMVNKADALETASVVFQDNWSGRAELGLAGNDDFSLKVSSDGASWAEALRVNAASGAVSALAGFQIGQQAAFHRGNVLGPVGQVGGIPTGALVETGNNSNGRYVRYADGTQICTQTQAPMLALDQPSAALGFRNAAPQIWTFPASFAASPVLSIATTTGSSAFANRNSTGMDYFIGSFSSQPAALRTATLMAIGRWF